MLDQGGGPLDLKDFIRLESFQPEDLPLQEMMVSQLPRILNSTFIEIFFSNSYNNNDDDDSTEDDEPEQAASI